MKNLLKESGAWKEEFGTILDNIQSGCKVCKEFPPQTPARPVVALRPASYFNHVLTMDLKEWEKTGNYRYILHLIDAFT